MEDDAEKMAALKKAYADIIFNTAKESAERILMAERRALGFQQRLFAAKEEALATMLRLKAIMEDKIRGAEKAARIQEKKIEELELQLGEAEDTIVDLREELKRVREELTMMKDASDQPLDDGNINDSYMVCNKIEKEASTDNLDEPWNMLTNDDDMTTLSQKIADTHQFRLQHVAMAEYPKDFSIWKSKVPELYKNGCTQSIHGLEHNSTSKGPFGEINGFHSYSPCEQAEKLGIAFKSDSRKPVKTLEPGQVPFYGGEDHAKFFSKTSPKKQRALYNQSNSLSDGVLSDKYKSWASSSMLAVHDKQNKTEAPKEAPSSSIPGLPASTEIDEIIEVKSTGGDASNLISSQCKSGTYINKEGMGIKHCTERIAWESVKKQQNPSDCDNEFKQNFLQSSEDVKDPLLSRTVSKADDHPSFRSIQKDLVDKIEVAVVSREVENVAESPENCATVEPDTKDVLTGTPQTGTDKFLKYTFQRKRKRGCSPVKSDELPDKKSTSKPKFVDKQTSVPVPIKSSSVTDLPRNNRRLVQVARQLISLSEKKW